MEARRAKVDLAHIERKNEQHGHWTRHFGKLVDAITKDPEKSKRHDAQQCPNCYYGDKIAGRIGGAAMTRTQCAFCETITMFGSTAVDILCDECARKADLCKTCGADIDLKNRKNRELPGRMDDTGG